MNLSVPTPAFSSQAPRTGGHIAAGRGISASASMPTTTTTAAGGAESDNSRSTALGYSTATSDTDRTISGAAQVMSQNRDGGITNTSTQATTIGQPVAAGRGISASSLMTTTTPSTGRVITTNPDSPPVSPHFAEQLNRGSSMVQNPRKGSGETGNTAATQELNNFMVLQLLLKPMNLDFTIHSYRADRKKDKGTAENIYADLLLSAISEEVGSRVNLVE